MRYLLILATICAVLVLVGHEVTMAATGHGAAGVVAGSGDHRHHPHQGTGELADGGSGSRPVPCDAIREVAPALQRPALEPVPVVAPAGTLSVAVGPTRAAAIPPEPPTLPEVRCRAVLQVYRI